MPGPRLAPRVRALSVAALLASAAVAISACQRETTPPLIQVTRVTPREVEQGDRLSVEGVGFPEGKVAHVSFRGDLHRAGAPPVTGVVVEVDGVVGSTTGIELPVDAALTRLFVGAGEYATHTTFSGDVTVAFASTRPAAPPVAGTLHDTWLDLRPEDPHRPRVDAEAAEGERTLAFLGLTASPARLGAGGVLLAAVAPGSRADAARLLPGDVITEFDGLRVMSVRDLVACPGSRGGWLKIRRAESSHEEVALVSLVGLSPPPAAALLTPALILGVTALLLFLFLAPAPSWLGWLERTLAARLPGGGAGSRASGLTALLGRGATLPVIAVTSLFLFLAFAHAPFGLEVDAGNLLLGALTAVAAVALVARSAPAGRPRGLAALRDRLRASFRVVTFGIPVAASLVAAVVESGSLRLDDLVRGQGGAPWTWNAFRNPSGLLLLLVAGLATVALVSPEAASSRLAPLALRAPGSPARNAAPRVLVLSSWAYAVVVAALGAALLLGGWQVPGLASEQLASRPEWALVGAALYALKAWGLLVALAAARAAFPWLGEHVTLSFAWRWLVPLALLALAGGGAWAFSGAGTNGETLVGAITLAVSVAACARVGLGALRVRGASMPALDPFV